jgi:CheY-like chemotaxis protein
LGGKVSDGKVHGTGLGLAISSGIVLEHGGRIDLKSRPGQGAVFSVKLRPAERGQHASGKRGESVASSPGSRAQRALRVLVVDDERVVRELLKEILQQRGHEVLLAEDGDEGLKIFSSERGSFDTVVADYQMPGMDGMRLFEAIRGCATGGRPPRLVMVTGRLDGDMGQPECVDHLLRKPFGTEAIIGAVEG